MMALSNKLGSMVLTTGNKSELGWATAPCTATCAAAWRSSPMCPRRWCTGWPTTSTRAPAIPESTIDKPPSAELRPEQKDSDSLPPYEILDTVLVDYVENNKSPQQIAAEHGYDLQLVRGIARMVDRSEYKRQQAAPGLKISEKAFGFGRRYPIAAKTECSLAATNHSWKGKMRLVSRCIW